VVPRSRSLASNTGSFRGPWQSELHRGTAVVRRHYLGLAVPLLGRVLLAGLVIIGLIRAGVLNPQTVLVGVLAATLWIAAAWARWHEETLTLSGLTLTLRRGLVVRSCRMIAVDAVQGVATQQSLIGLLLGYGSLDIQLRDGSEIKLHTIPDPQAVRDRILSARFDVRGET
jgi:hypothetical protein